MKINNDKIKSPCFIINKKILKENVDNIVSNCKKMHNNVIISYSLKTNSIPYLVWIYVKFLDTVFRDFFICPYLNLFQFLYW